MLMEDFTFYDNSSDSYDNNSDSYDNNSDSDDNNKINEDINDEDENMIVKLDSFDKKMPIDFTKEKKMSLIIASLFELLFDQDKEKLSNILTFLISKNMLDKDVLNKKYDTFRNSLSLLIDSYNKNDDSKNLSFDYSNNVYRNNYNQISLLGQGSFGTVYKVFHKLERKYYAVKKIFLTKEVLEENINIINETYLYSQLEHKNIVKYYNSWISTDFQSIVEFNNIIDINDMETISSVCPVLFIQMELCNFTLDEYFLTQMLDDNVKERMLYFKDILDGIKYLHNNGIVHRDIKPNNIFFVNNGNGEYDAKIGDLGLCKTDNKLLIEDNNTIINDFYNEYSSNKSDTNLMIMSSHLEKSFHRPQIIPHEDDINYLFDIYSLGIILFEFLLDCKTEFEKIKTIVSLKEDPDNIHIMTNIITHDYDDLIIKMISKDCDKRPSIDNIYDILY
jgi:tRNA A-37 threonylcarbamoyl transferase component Bud32